MRPVEEPYQLTGQIGRLIYFRFYPFHSLLERLWDMVMRYLQFRFSCNVDGQISDESRAYDGGLDLK